MGEKEAPEEGVRALRRRRGKQPGRPTRQLHRRPLAPTMVPSGRSRKARPLAGITDGSVPPCGVGSPHKGEEADRPCNQAPPSPLSSSSPTTHLPAANALRKLMTLFPSRLAAVLSLVPSSPQFRSVQAGRGGCTAAITPGVVVHAEARRGDERTRRQPAAAANPGLTRAPTCFQVPRRTTHARV